MKQENQDYETALDALLDYIQFLPKPTVKLLNVPRYAQLMKAATNLQRLIAETVPEGFLAIEFENDFNLACISTELPELSVTEIRSFCTILQNADNLEIYPLTNGHLRLDITFQRMLKTIC